MKIDYLDIYALAERLNREFLDRLQTELDYLGIRDINNVRALIVLNVGTTEMTVSELMWRGCYLGTNVSYNLKKLTESGYILQEKSPHDRRVIMVRNSEKGLALCGALEKLSTHYFENMPTSNLKADDLAICRQTLKHLQQILSQAMNAPAAPRPDSAFGLRPQFGAELG